MNHDRFDDTAPYAPREQPAALAADEDTLVQEEAARQHSAELSRRGEEAPGAVPGYEILRCLGEGAFGSVWLAREQNTGREVAVKFYSHRRGLDWPLLSREVEKLAALYTSRRIVRLLEVGWNSDPPYYVMEYLRNGSLSTLLKEGTLSVYEAVRLTVQVLQALIHAHGSGILHCDLKPSNILLDEHYEPRICDFGQSRLSGEQTPALGTLFYMAPEQADPGAIPDARWDVYAVGALLYQMLCGEPPFRSAENERRIRETDTLPERLAVYREILERSPRPAAHRKIRGVDKRLAEIIDRCLQVDPLQRYPNAQAVFDELETRDRQRARRPLVALGVVVPALLLAFMFPLAGSAIEEAVLTAQQNLVQRALESDGLSAEIAATSLARDLEDRKLELVRISRDVQLRKQLMENTPKTAGRPPEARAELFSLLEEHYEASNEHRQQLNLSTDTSWFFTDRKGVQRWRSPYDEKTIDEDYSFREYFTGKPQGTVRENPRPITAPHITQPFRSQATGRYMVAIAVPVFDPDEPRTVIGVLARTAHLGELLQGYGRRIRQTETGGEETIDRILALVDQNDWRLLDHPWMTEERLQNLPDSVFNQLKLPPETVQKLEEVPENGNASRGVRRYLADYSDPVAGIGGAADDSTGLYAGEWLAAVSPVGETGWFVVVQERRPAALAPVDDMRTGLVKSGLWALVLFLGLIALAWSFVWRAMKERSLRLPTLRNGSSNR